MTQAPASSSQVSPLALLCCQPDPGPSVTQVAVTYASSEQIPHLLIRFSTPPGTKPPNRQDGGQVLGPPETCEEQPCHHLSALCPNDHTGQIGLVLLFLPGEGEQKLTVAWK